MDVTRAILRIFYGTEPAESINNNILVLIPKVNRLKEILPKILSEK